MLNLDALPFSPAPVMRCWVQYAGETVPLQRSIPVVDTDSYKCVRYQWICKSSEISNKASPCYGKQAGSSVWNYSVLSDEVIAESKSQLVNLLACTGDYCNMPIVPSPRSSGAASKTVSVKPCATSKDPWLRCWMKTGRIDDAPVRATFKNPPGFSCFRTKRSCNTEQITDKTHPCYHSDVGYEYWHYGVLSDEGVREYKKSHPVSPNALICSTSYCNEPVQEPGPKSKRVKKTTTTKCNAPKPTSTTSSKCNASKASPSPSPSKCNVVEPSPSPSTSNCKLPVPSPSPSTSKCNLPVPSPTPGIKCWETKGGPSDIPSRSPRLHPLGTLCYRYYMTCTSKAIADETSVCFRKEDGFIWSVYGAASVEKIAEMRKKATKTKFFGLQACKSRDYCNTPKGKPQTGCALPVVKTTSKVCGLPVKTTSSARALPTKTPIPTPSACGLPTKKTTTTIISTSPSCGLPTTTHVPTIVPTAVPTAVPTLVVTSVPTANTASGVNPSQTTQDSGPTVTTQIVTLRASGTPVNIANAGLKSSVGESGLLMALIAMQVVMF